MRRLNPYVFAWLHTVQGIGTIPVTISEYLAVQEAQESVQAGPCVVLQPLQVDEFSSSGEPHPLDAAGSEIAEQQEAPETTKCENPDATRFCGAIFPGPRVVKQPPEIAFEEPRASEQPLEVVAPEASSMQHAQEDAKSGPSVLRPKVEVAPSNSPVHSQSRPFYSFMTTTVPRLKVYAFPMRVQDFNPNWIRLVTRGGDVDTAVAFLFGLIKLFCRADYYKVLQGSEDDCLWLEEVKIDNRRLQKVMSGSQPVATIDDVFVLFGVMLCNVNSEEGTSHDHGWFRDRVNCLALLFPLVSEPPPVPLYSESQANGLSTLGKMWPCTIAQIVCTISAGRFKGPMKRIQGYVCAQWQTAEMRGTKPQPLQSVTPDPSALKEAEEIPGHRNPLSSAPRESDMHNTLVTQASRQEPGSNPANVVPREDVTCIAAVLKTTDVGRSMPPAMTTQKVFVFPLLGQFNATWIRLVTRSIDPVTAVPCLLGFIDLMCGDNFEKVLDSADKEGLVLEPLKLSKGELRQRLRDLMTDWYPPATMDDFYVLLGILLCNLSCRQGSDLNRGWYQTRAKDLVGLFPNVSGEVSVRLYDEAKADAICAFAERWPHTRAAIGSVILKGRFEGPMHRLQQYVSTSWSFAGMKHAECVLESLVIRNPWVLSVFPELKSKDLFLQATAAASPGQQGALQNHRGKESAAADPAACEESSKTTGSIEINL